MKEYCLYIQNGDAIPYILKTYNNFIQAKLDLLDIVKLEEERRRPYFVDNDFFNNKNTLVSNSKYLCIKVREVTKWDKYYEYDKEKNLTNNSNFNKLDNHIINFSDFILKKY